MKFAAKIYSWMHTRSWAIAMTVAIVITVGGLVILETARERVAAEYEAALEARGVATRLAGLAAQVWMSGADPAVFDPIASTAAWFDVTPGRAERR